MTVVSLNQRLLHLLMGHLTYVGHFGCDYLIFNADRLGKFTNHNA